MKSIKLNFAYNILLNLSRIIFPLITAPYISRILEPEGVGLFNFAYTYAGYFAILAVLGVPTYGIREIAKTRNDKSNMRNLVSELMTISIGSTLISTLCFIVTLFIIPQLENNKALFLVAGFVIYFAPIRIDWYYSGLERFGFITSRTLILRVISIIAIFIFIRTKNDVIIYMLIYCAGTIGGDIWNLIKLLREGIKPRIKFSGLKKHISPLIVLFTSTVAISIYTILDTLMLGFMTSYDQVGFYNSATHISKAALAIVTSLSSVAIPRIALYSKENDIGAINQLMSKSFSIVSFLAFPLTIGIMSISPIFVPLFFGIEFKAAIAPLMIISFVILFIGFNNLTGVQVLVGLGYDKLFFKSVLIGALINLFLNLITIPLWGASGAALSSVIAELSILIIGYIYIIKKTKVRFHNVKGDFLKSVSGAMLFIPISIVLSNIMNGWCFIIADIFCCSILYILSQSILKNTSIIQLKKFITDKFNK